MKRSRATSKTSSTEFTKIAVAHQRTKTLRAEAEQCVGESSVYSSDTDVEVEVDPDLTQDDPTKPIDMPPGLTSPVASSSRDTREVS